MGENAMQSQRPKIAVVTGGLGGIGQACARLLGRRYKLVLGDIDEGRLSELADRLRAEGHDVLACVAGDLAEVTGADRLVEAACEAGTLACVVHAAGLSPALAGWEAIIRANLVSTELLLQAIERQQTRGLVAVLLASMAGHLAPADPETDAAAADPLNEGLLSAMYAPISRLTGSNDEHALARSAYAQSKRAVLRIAQQRAAAWGKWGGRILSVSPGIISTPMGHKEVDGNPYARHTLESTPAARWGSPLDIANAVDFLASDFATFITGCDLRVDGGVTTVLASRQGIDFLPGA
jgi:NAD(P)-dependent dehydrogenase (short-subunit alcohol dehydrogenase family)